MIKYKGNVAKAIAFLKNDQNNAVSHVYETACFGEGLLGQATITLKDLFATKDAPTQASSQILENFTPLYDADVVRLLKKHGAAIVGKTHLDELGLGGTGTFSGFGTIKHPRDKSRMVGGSSSGSAATLIRSITGSICSDTGDSVRLPASYNGLVGFKPSYGAVSRYGMFAYASSLDTVAWFTHCVNDSIILSQALFGRSKKDHTSKDVEKPVRETKKPRRVAFLKLDNVLPASLLKEYRNLQKRLFEQEKIDVQEITIDQKLLDLIEIVYSVISYSEVSSNDANLTGINFGKTEKKANWQEAVIQSRTQNLGKMVQQRLTLGAFFLLAENQDRIFIKAQKLRRVFQQTMNKIYQNFDCFVYVSALEAPKITENKEDNWFSSVCTISNLVGNPSVSIPFSEHNGLPIGISVDTKLYSDQRLLSYALFLEDVLGGKNG